MNQCENIMTLSFISLHVPTFFKIHLLCVFQVFMSDGKILQFRSESVESQAHWMAALKVGLGKGISHIYTYCSCHMHIGALPQRYGLYRLLTLLMLLDQRTPY